MYCVLQSFTYHQVPNMYEFLQMMNTKEDILKNVGNQKVDG